MRPDVFVSYTQADRDCAFEIVAQLESCGVNVWVAPRDVLPSADWAAEIIDAIAASRLMVLVFSAACNDSPQVRREVERAVHRQLPILPFRVEAVLPVKSLEYFLSSQHWLDAFPAPLAPHYERLCKQVKSILHPAAPPESSRQHFSPHTLQALQRNLAEHIGPLAAYLVNRAAVAAQDRDQLIETLAAEIDSPAGRRQFIESSLADSPSGPPAKMP
jgi:hypothetical protein